MSTGPPACEAVTYSDGVCYLKSEPGAVYNTAGSDSAFVIITPNGPETPASGYSSGNISQAAPSCPDANGQSFESNGYVYVVGCDIDNYVVDISTAPGADLASCVISCVSFSGTGTQSCAAVTYDDGTCHFRGSVGTVFHNAGADTAFIIAGNSNVTSGAPSAGPSQLGLPPPPPSGIPLVAPSGISLVAPSGIPLLAPSGIPLLAPSGIPLLPPSGVPSPPPNPSGPYTVSSGSETSPAGPTQLGLPPSGSPSPPPNPCGPYTMYSGSEALLGGPTQLGLPPSGNSSLPPNSCGPHTLASGSEQLPGSPTQSLPPNPTGTYTMYSGSEVIVYEPFGNETCP
ncbi:hypothetical protein IMSHALPRED_004813 [Imshaugia aleurites]|uniref:Apple domain-containing protein n=1 Tax=Imshaugia aleurites TaxID=172621 RepID=A0A8H3FFT1_9LECA|nr:hypothetical protein IMSHALPRED_004813 [Imshaugia aleurites]